MKKKKKEKIFNTPEVLNELLLATQTFKRAGKQTY